MEIEALIRIRDGKPASGAISGIGICLGASTVSVVLVEKDASGSKPRIIAHSLYPHEGDPRKTLLSALRSFDPTAFDRIASTGRRFRNFVNLSTISEPVAVEFAYRHVKPEGIDCSAVVSAGGETSMAYILDSFGRISNVLTGNKCASGTGEFFLQQLRRMNVTLEEAADYAVTESPYPVSGRCSVFCKSDCTHATNKGIPKARVTAGLCKMMSNKILELLKKEKQRNIMVAGGTSQNRMMVEYLRREIPGIVIPKEAPYFEALGAALWALENETLPFPGAERLFQTGFSSFDHLQPLRNFGDMVEFKTMEMGQIGPGDDCILGLDVGSTTTKAVLIRSSDHAMLASVYLRTNGDPVGASRGCYRAILDQIRKRVSPSEIMIGGLGVCGSGRQIAGLHAFTDGVINEIIAHAAAAVHFDPKVDTLFEIGGQDAKYTYITNGVPSDYAMNEACSAGTGSFLEESALETLGVKMTEIAEIALKGDNPPNFNDQCAAFIGSDIKTAIHEGIRHEDIVAGLVYSICMNYANRVKGNRPVGAKVFMQGGVCYNRTIPLAMAALVGKPIVVPPEPGLMGAFGVALEVKKRIERGLIEWKRFDLEALIGREVESGPSFTCKGGGENCDRRCEIAVIRLEGKKIPFGGACNRYYNLRHDIRHDTARLDLVRVRQHLIFGKYDQTQEDRVRGTIGINRSFLVNTYFPLYFRFFDALGFPPVVPTSSSQEGIDRRNAPFCYPGELAHGFFYTLLRSDPRPDFIFLPHFKSVPSQNGLRSSQVCPFVQGEPFFLRSTFREEIAELERRGTRILDPLLNLVQGLEAARLPMIETAQKMGIPRKEAEKAFKHALREQLDFQEAIEGEGRRVLAELAATPEKIATVIFSRPYSGFVEEAHMGIPRKFASRGIHVIPIDFLPIEEETSKRHMYWGMGQLILRAAHFVKRHPQLFGTYITNFSCGPDSFVVGYFRDIMGQKPSLTLELDSHTADAGLETRIEAFLDIVAAYRQLESGRKIIPPKHESAPARTLLTDPVPRVMTSSGEILPMKHPRVTLLFPSMGRLSTEALVAVFRGYGFRTVAHPPSDETILKLGRANTSCKECLPLILTTGNLLSYIRNRKRPDEVLVYFMPTASGPCRFGQYYIFMEDLIERLGIKDVALFSLTAENGYGGLGKDLHRRSWWAAVTADVMEDLRAMLLANARDVPAAMAVFDREWREILAVLGKEDFNPLEKRLVRAAEEFKGVPLKRPPEEVPVISLMGEIFVRRDELSRQRLTERLAERGFATVCSPIAEWLHYCDYLVACGLSDHRTTLLEKLKFMIKQNTMSRYEKRIKSALSGSGLVSATLVDISAVIENALPYLSLDLTGEAILTIGNALTEIVSHSAGVISIGPFGCMPSRLSEAILTETMNREGKLATDPENRYLQAVLTRIEDLPFLAIESDGSPFPQLILAKLESFCLRAERLHKEMRKAKADSACPI